MTAKNWTLCAKTSLCYNLRQRDYANYFWDTKWVKARIGKIFKTPCRLTTLKQNFLIFKDKYKYDQTSVRVNGGAS